MRQSLSVIIACYNEEQLLPLCLDTLIKQQHELGPKGEIIIAINGSTDNSRKIAHRYSAKNSIVKTLLIDEAHKKLAMNAALDVVDNRYVIFCDADSSFDSTAVSQIKTMLRQDKYAIVGAIRRPNVDMKMVNVNFLETYFMLHYAKRLSLKSADRLSVQGWLMAVDTQKFKQLRFPVDNSPDDIWLSAHTWMELGPQAIGYIPHAIGTYSPPSTLEDMERQILRHRSNHKAVQKFHPELLPYFLSRRAYYGTVESSVRWRQTSIDLGVDFDTWIPLYKQFAATIDKKIALGEYVYGEKSSWDRISSSKLLPQKK